MKVNYNIQKEERKAMVWIVGKVLEMKPTYCGAPSFSYKVGAFEITKDGSLCFDDATDEATVARVRTALREAGFTSEDWENEASCADTGANEPIPTETANTPTEVAAPDELIQTEVTVNEEMPAETTVEEPTEVDTAESEPVSTEAAPTEEAMAEPEEDILSISLPRTLFTEKSGRTPSEQGAADSSRFRHQGGNLHADR